MIIALAGRRLDAPDAEVPRFPMQNVEKVRVRIRAFLRDAGATALVSSAACGADLIGLSEAGNLGVRCRVILPFDRMRFRKTSVTDRPGEWGSLYDEILDAIEGVGDLVILNGLQAEDAYRATNHAILDEAVAMANAVLEPMTALLVWECASRGGHDLTEEFGAEARKRGLAVAEVASI